MTTHHKQEVPERCSVGSVYTGYHAVDVKVTSVSGYLPSGEDNNAPFTGITDKNIFAAPSLTPVEEAAMRAQQIEIQRRDAVERRVVWNSDDDVVGADSSDENTGDAHGKLTHTKRYVRLCICIFSSHSCWIPMRGRLYRPTL